jgi:predicted MFS family arabinose efflux permease
MAPAQGVYLRQRLAVFSVALGTFTLVTNEFLPVALLTGIRTSLGVSQWAAATMVTLPAAVAAIASPALAVASGRLDRRLVLLLMAGLFTASDALSAAAPNFATMLVARFLLGAGIGGFWAIGASIGGRLVPEPRAAWARAVIFSGISLAIVLGVPIASFVGGWLGWRVAFGATAGLGLLALVLMALLLPRIGVERPVTRAQLAAVLRAPNARLGLVVTVGLVAGQYAAYTFITPFLATADHAGPTVVSALLLVFGIGGLVGNFGVVRLLRRRLRATVVAMAATLAVATAVMPVLGGWRPAAAVVLAVWGLAYGAMTVAMQTWVFTADGRDLWSGSALYPAVFQASIAVGSLLGGAVVGVLGDRGAIWTGTVFAALALLGFGLFARPTPAGSERAGPEISDRGRSRHVAGGGRPRQASGTTGRDGS